MRSISYVFIAIMVICAAAVYLSSGPAAFLEVNSLRVFRGYLWHLPGVEAAVYRRIASSPSEQLLPWATIRRELDKPKFVMYRFYPNHRMRGGAGASSGFAMPFVMAFRAIDDLSDHASHTVMNDISEIQAALREGRYADALKGLERIKLSAQGLIVDEDGRPHSE